MTKITDAHVSTLKAYFETDDQPTQAQFADFIEGLQEAVQEHQHRADGGASAGTGDAASRTPIVTSGGTTIGYFEFIAADDVDGTATTIIADGSDDVTAILWANVAINPSSGTAQAGTVFVRKSDSTTLWDDGTDVLTLAVAADGSTTLQRTSGSTITFDVGMLALWI